MTGADVKQQVMQALNNAYRREGYGGGWLLIEDEKAIPALAPCIVLTAEEAKKVNLALSFLADLHPMNEDEPCVIYDAWNDSLALLTPGQEASDD